jgi:hypothetical protein
MYAQHCGQYELVIVPFSVSVKRTGITIIGNLKVEAQLVASPFDQLQPIITSVSPANKEKTKEVKTAPVAINIGAQGAGFSFESDVDADFQIEIVTSSVKSGFGRSNAYWEFSERGLSGTFQMAILAAVDPHGIYRLRVKCDIRSLVGLRRLSHAYDAALILPTRPARRIPRHNGSTSAPAGDT